MIAKVLVEISHSNIDKTFDYKVPLKWQNIIKVGQRVLVPFASMRLEGFVLGLASESELKELKEIQDVIDEDFYLSDELLRLAKVVSEETLSTNIAALQVMLPKGVKARRGTSLNIKMNSYIELNNKAGIKASSKEQEDLLNHLRNKGRVLKSSLKDFSPSSIKTLTNKGFLIETKTETYRQTDDRMLQFDYEPTVLQASVLEAIYKAKDNKVFLLHGVTGSGKTIIYIELIKKVLAENKTAILLLPEISITVQTIALFRYHFGDSIAVYHSRLSDGERYDEYRRIYRGEVKIVIGARSAVFMPLKNIGAIIVDEEHSSSYKQDASPKYDAIEVAKLRAKNHGAICLLGSATPSLESYARAKKGVYKLLILDKRPFDIELPDVNIIDMTKEKNRASLFSKLLTDEINNSLDKNKQIMLLLNRRGFSNYIVCSSCSYVDKCSNCDISLTYHKSSNMMRCHYCGYAHRKPDICPTCHEDGLKSLGSGTEKIEEELQKQFPAKVIRMDLDTTSGKNSHQKIIDSFRNKEADILLGTQMISKGLDFEEVNLVGIINADTSLMIPNFRASEETFQLLSQVAGRAGRKGDKSQVIIQSHNPDHYAIKYAKTHDYVGFYNEEMKYRKMLSYPPYYYLVLVKIISKDYDVASKTSAELAYYLKQKLAKTTIVLGPSVAAVFKLRGQYNFNIILKYKYDDDLKSVLKTAKEHFSNKNVKIDISFNPWFI